MHKKTDNPHFQNLRNALSEYRQMEDNWDDDGFPAPLKSSIAVAERFASILEDKISQDIIQPNPTFDHDGIVELIYNNDDLDQSDWLSFAFCEDAIWFYATKRDFKPDQYGKVGSLKPKGQCLVQDNLEEILSLIHEYGKSE